MPAFQALNRDWLIRFDGLLLGELREVCGIDLADIGGESWLKLETDQTALTKAVCFVCRDQLGSTTPKQLADALCGETAEAAFQALWGAAKVFFRPKLWSVLESACEQRREMREQWKAIAPMMSLLNQPEMPAAMREAVMTQLGTIMEAMSGSSASSEGQPSVSGLVVTPSKPATDSPEPVALAPAA